MYRCWSMRLGMTVVASAIVGAGCSSLRHEVTERREPPDARVGTASWYGAEFQGRRTASGERFDARSLTAAARSYPLGTRVRVTNVANRRSVVVRINDRGPFVRGRVLDVSHAAARELGMVDRGTARVRIEPVARVSARSTTSRAHATRRRRR